LREIGKEAFSGQTLRLFSVPLSVEILGDRCFEKCHYLRRLTFAEKSSLKKIGERAFAFAHLQLFTIPASVNGINGSAFVGCPLEVIGIDPGNRRFIVNGNTLLISDGTEIVRSFVIQQKIFVRKDVEVHQNSCFESLEYLTELTFESGSKVRKICRSALSGCD
jgi:hypothetical protein